jgi:hypothetical protein
MSLALQTRFLITLDTAQGLNLGINSCLFSLVALRNGLSFSLLQEMESVDKCLGSFP